MTPAAAAPVVAALAGAVALLCTPVVRALALRVGLVARPSADRWHQQTTALLGGIAIAVATGIGVLAWFLLGGLGVEVAGSARGQLAAGAVAVSALFMFGVGLIDDLVRLRPQLKFSLQLLAGIALVAAGATLVLTPSHLVNVLATVFCFVALTNAFNLLDNMDGVAAGVGTIAATFLGVTFAFQHAWLHAAAAWALAGATLGFLRYNFPPARIFMGDTGSLFIGSLLAGLVLTSPSSVSGNLVAVLFVPLAIMAVPVVDTALVTVTRTLAARAISQGGRDHSTHRLVALGLAERQVALLLYGFAALGGGVGLLLTQLDSELGLMLGTIFLVALTLFAAYLGRLEMRYPDEPAGWKPATVLATELLYKKRLAAMLLDVALVAIAYYGAFRLRYGGDGGNGPLAMMDIYRITLWLVIAVKVIAFGMFGLYRGTWRYTSVIDAYRILAAILASSLVLFGLASWRFPVVADTNVLWIDALLTAALVLASRASFRSLELLRTRFSRRGEPVAIYGAGDGGELAVRELLNNGALGLNPVCFLDDDPLKHGERIHGVPVVGGVERLASAVTRDGVRRVLIATQKLSAEVLAALRAAGPALEIELLELEIRVRPLAAAARSEARGVRIRAIHQVRP
jgi:UDP-GlcNAc:undecaprenyl-phosphate GlcNAc-1-phosphate transferase